MYTRFFVAKAPLNDHTERKNYKQKNEETPTICPYRNLSLASFRLRWRKQDFFGIYPRGNHPDEICRKPHTGKGQRLHRSPSPQSVGYHRHPPELHPRGEGQTDARPFATRYHRPHATEQSIGVHGCTLRPHQGTGSLGEHRRHL